MRRFLYTTSVESVSGSQTWYIDAETREEADALAEEGQSGGIYEEDIEVEHIGEMVFCDETTTDDFGEFPPRDPNALTDAVKAALYDFLRDDPRSDVRLIGTGKRSGADLDRTLTRLLKG